jgi:hypothetical protein
MFPELGHFAVLVPVCGMITMLLINQTIALRTKRRQAARDTLAARVALQAELAVLRGVAEENLRLLADGAGHLLCTRGMTHVYRSHAGRLNALTPAEIAAIVSAYGACEATEAYAAATTKPQGNQAYRLQPADAPVEALKTRYVRLCDRIKAAGIAIEEAAQSVRQRRAESADGGGAYPVPVLIEAAAAE